jgi:predicted dehydrogenase
MTDNPAKSDNGLSRRAFLGTAATAAAGFMIVPRKVLGGPGFQAPSDTLDIGCVGVGGKGFSDVQDMSGENIVALCDVDDMKMAAFLNSDEHTSDRKEKYAKAAKYRDWRKMLEKGKDLDAITVSVPDHNHAVIAMAAMKMGKHVYIQKPLTHTIKEARLLEEEAKKRNLVTQMGNQGHAKEGIRLISEWIWAGAIGDVTEVHVWTDRPIWPQGVDAPMEIPSVPPNLDWDVWLGPAPWRPYHPALTHFVWRGWFDYGTGALGDMGAHLIDQPFYALKLGHPLTVQASSTKPSRDSYPVAEMVTYQFPAREGMPPVKMVWYDGGITPPRPLTSILEDGRMMGDEDGGGVLFVGQKGMIQCGTYGDNPRILPESLMQSFPRPEKTIPRSLGIAAEWIAAIKAGTKSTTDIPTYSGPLTEVMLLGNIAMRFRESKTILQWDPVKMEFPNLPEANAFVDKTYRLGWSL